MLKNYLTVALRSLAKNRLYTAINIFGLAIGLASCILIMLYVRHEISYDTWIPNAERIYQVHTRFEIPGREPLMAGQAPGPALAALTKDFNEIESAVRLLRQRPVITRGADVFREEIVLADSTFFQVLDLPLVSGNRETALSDVSSIILSESMAQKYFGTTSPIGQTLPLEFDFGLRRDYRVTGVFKDLPSNTTFEMDIVAPLNPSDFTSQPFIADSWTSVNTGLYLKLRPTADAEAIPAALPEFERRNIPNVSFGGQDFPTYEFITLGLLNIKDVHLYGHSSSLLKPPGDIRTITAFSLVAAMILLIACINFTNLATARASQRAREVALRKVLGARRKQLIFPFLCESVVLSVCAFILSLALVYAALPLYNTLLQQHLGMDILGEGSLLPSMTALIVIVGLGAGFYPALYLSRFLPARILKANKSAAAEGSGHLRAGLVVIQFAISITLLICTAVIYSQTAFVRNMDMGFDSGGLLVIRAPYGEQHQSLRSSLMTEAANIPGVVAVTISDGIPTDRGSNNNIVEVPGKPTPEPIVIEQRTVDYNFFKTYQVQLLAGRTFERGRGGDDFTGSDDDKVARGGNIVINQATLPRLGFASPEEAVGKVLRFGVGSADNSREAEVTVIGVVANIAYRSAHEPVEATIYRRDEDDFRNITLRTEGISGAAAYVAMEQAWRSVAPTLPYRAEFVKNLIDAQYQQEEAEATMFAAFCGLAIVISCLGLYGLALFSAERRTKEIGVRKVLGARIHDVVRLLVWDFSKPVFVANLIAWPVAWFLMRDWLSGFTSHIDLSPMIFVGAGIVALSVAWITVGGHAIRAARENPIHALRYE